MRYTLFFKGGVAKGEAENAFLSTMLKTFSTIFMGIKFLKIFILCSFKILE